MTGCLARSIDLAAISSDSPSQHTATREGHLLCNECAGIPTYSPLPQNRRLLSRARTESGCSRTMPCSSSAVWHAALRCAGPAAELSGAPAPPCSSCSCTTPLGMRRRPLHTEVQRNADGWQQRTARSAPGPQAACSSTDTATARQMHTRRWVRQARLQARRLMRVQAQQAGGLDKLAHMRRGPRGVGPEARHQRLAVRRQLLRALRTGAGAQQAMAAPQTTALAPLLPGRGWQVPSACSVRQRLGCYCQAHGA